MKIEKALYEKREISLNDYREEMNGNLHCPCCGVPITYVAKYIRQSGNEEIEVSPYFRLSKNPHLSSCKYLVKNRLNEIYKNLKEQEGECDFIEKQEENCFKFHLRIVTDETFPKKGKSSITYENNKTVDEFQKKRQNAFLKTVKDIISLKDSIETDDEKDLKRMFQLNFYNRRTKINECISWDKFFYSDDIESYWKLYLYIEKNKATHPLCIVGQIKKIVHKEKYIQINLKAHKKSDNELIAITFTTKNEEVIIKLKENQKIAVYAQGFRVHTNESKTDRYEIFYNNINAWINVPGQIFVL